METLAESYAISDIFNRFFCFFDFYSGAPQQNFDVVKKQVETILENTDIDAGTGLTLSQRMDGLEGTIGNYANSWNEVSGIAIEAKSEIDVLNGQINDFVSYLDVSGGTITDALRTLDARVGSAETTLKYMDTSGSSVVKAITEMVLQDGRMTNAISSAKYQP